MRRLVQAGAPEAERWALIHDTRQQYLETYFELTGMQEEQLDDLLAGDWLREGVHRVSCRRQSCGHRATATSPSLLWSRQRVPRKGRSARMAGGER